MIRSALRTVVIGNVGRTDKDSLINTYFQLALDDAMTRHGFRDSLEAADVSAALDADSVTLPAGTMKVFEVRVIDPSAGSNSQKLQISSKKVVVGLYPSVTDYPSSQPQVGYFDGNRLFFYPKANKAYTIRFTISKQVGDDFDSDSKENPIRILDNALISYATAYLFMGLEQFDAGALWMRRYEIDLTKAIAVDERNPARDLHFRPHQALVDMSRLTPEYWKDPFVGHRAR